MTSQLSSSGLSDISGMHLLVRAQRRQHRGFITGKQSERKQKGKAKEMAHGREHQSVSLCSCVSWALLGQSGWDRHI